MRANLFEVDTVPTPVSTLDEATRDKLAKLPKPKVVHSRTGMMSTHVENMVLMDQIDPLRFKLNARE